MENFSPNSTQDSKQSPEEEMVKFVNDTIYKLLQAKIGSKLELTHEVVIQPGKLKAYCDTEKLQSSKIQDKLEGIIETRIESAYPFPDVEAIEADIAAKVVKALVQEYGPEQPSVHAPTPAEVRQLEYAFTKTKYIGDAHLKFAQYLRQCDRVYQRNRYKAPYVAVAQSSGFGKSRMLRELALKAENDQTLKMKVLYTCMRAHNSSGYPQATPGVFRWLFPKGTTVEALTKRLKAIFYYAVHHWDTVQTEWKGLFTNTATDATVAVKLEEALKGQATEGSREKVSSDNLVLVVVDEARHLFNDPESGLSHFRMFRQALVQANDDMGSEGKIFGVVVDTNSKIGDFSPPTALDPSYRVGTKVPPLFTPFVITHTMDVNWEEYCQQTLAGIIEDEETKESGDGLVASKIEDGETKESGDVLVAANQEKEIKVPMADQIIVYKQVVTGNEEIAWCMLKRMGRPLWYGITGDKTKVIDLAANKLMLGVGPSQKSNYNESTLFGVASMLCRLGVRPYSNSSFASRAVGDFMAILAYVNFERDCYLNSYASDPVLTCGAIKVWYKHETVLVNCILPQLKKLIFNEVLDTGGVGEMVARIILLLAMDRCVLDANGKVNDNLIGQLVPVSRFLAELQVEEMQMYHKGFRKLSAEQTKTCNEWLSKWGNWQMGFTHFVQLVLEPNKDTLWYLLGRRAAGVFPRGQYGADLLIPMVKTGDSNGKTEDEVSVILIQVKNRIRDGEFTEAATAKLFPSFVFQAPGNPLKEFAVTDTIRMYLNLGDEHTESYGHVFIYATSAEVSTKATTGEPNSNHSYDLRQPAKWEPVYALCFRSISTTTFSFLSDELAVCLSSIVESGWPPMAQVKADLKNRPGDNAISNDELLAVASNGLLEMPGQEAEKKRKRDSTDSGPRKDAAGKLQKKPSPSLALEDVDDELTAAIPLEKMTVKILKERLKEHGLPVKGRKAELVQRLKQATGEE